MSLDQIQSLKAGDFKKKSVRKKKKNVGVPLAFFFQILSKKLFVEFLILDSWNGLWGTKKDVHGRRLLIVSIYRVKKWNTKYTLSLQPPTRELFHPPGQ